MKFKIAKYYRAYDVVEVEAENYIDALIKADNGEGELVEEAVFNDWMDTDSWTGEDENGKFYD